jgi:hypothetical protein
VEATVANGGDSGGSERIGGSPGVGETPGTGGASPERGRSGALSLPLVRFGSGDIGEYQGGPLSTGARDPEIRNIEVLAPRVPPAPPPSAPAEPAMPDRTYYVIQLRAPELPDVVAKMEIHLKEQGFTNTIREPAGRNELGQSLFTLVLGPYLERSEADRECTRLKDNARRVPFKRGFFLDSYVLARQPR